MVAKRAFDYEAGTIFCVPLRQGGFARGVVARCDGKGLVFGFFFGPLLEHKPQTDGDDELRPSDAILVGQFGDIGLRNGEWAPIGRVEVWCQEDWPMPLFVGPANDEDHITLTQYDNETLDTKLVTTVARSDVDSSKLPVDGVMGYGFVEIKLTRLLGDEEKKGCQRKDG